MSDDDAKKPGGYRLEYASSGRAKCKGSAIPKGALRLGSQVDFRGNTTFVWRHWGCVTPQILANFKKSFDTADELDGFEELKATDKERVRKAWEEEKVADEDVPESAKKGSGDDGEEEEAKSKNKRAAPKKKAKKDDDDDDDDERPKKKKAPAKKAPAKKKAIKKKQGSDSEGEDFGEELDKASDEEDEGDYDAEAGKKRKRAPPKKTAGSKKTKKPASKKMKKNASDDEAEDD